MNTTEANSLNVNELFNYEQFKLEFKERYRDRVCTGLDWLIMVHIILVKSMDNAFVKDSDTSTETVWMNNDPEAFSIDPSYVALYYHRLLNEEGKTVYEWLLRTYIVDTCKIVDNTLKESSDGKHITSFSLNGLGLTDVTIFSVAKDDNLEEDAYLDEAKEFAGKLLNAVTGLSRTINTEDDPKEEEDGTK